MAIDPDEPLLAGILEGVHVIKLAEQLRVEASVPPLGPAPRERPLPVGDPDREPVSVVVIARRGAEIFVVLVHFLVLFLCG